MAMKESTIKMFKYLQAHPNDNLTVEDLANAIGLSPKTVGPAFTMAIQNKKMGVRVEAKDAEGNTVKLLKLNDAGKAFDIDAKIKADEEAAAAKAAKAAAKNA